MKSRPDMVRWHGAEPVRRFSQAPCRMRKGGAPGGARQLMPITRQPNILTVDFTDFVCFNVYLHDQPPSADISRGCTMSPSTSRSS